MKQKGFTLIELLTVFGIIIFLSAIILINYRTSGEQFALQRSAHKLTHDIRRAAELAMSSKEFQGNIPQGGYGIHLRQANDDYYILYADTNGNEKYDAVDGKVETIYFEKGVFIKFLSKNNLSINFKPPNPTVKIDTSPTVTITLSLQSDSSRIKTIKVNDAGLIEVE